MLLGNTDGHPRSTGGRPQRRLRRTATALAVAVALPAAFMTSQAAALTAPVGATSCTYNGTSYSVGSHMNQNGYDVTCTKNGAWKDD